MDTLIRFSGEEDILAFHKKVYTLQSDIDIIAGSIHLDGKSLMGLFILDITKPVHLRIIEKGEGELTDLLEFLAERDMLVKRKECYCVS